jgi:integrase
VRLGDGFKKHKGLGLYFNPKTHTAKVKVHRPGAHGRRPFVATLKNVTIEEARERYWAFRKCVLESGEKPGAPKKRGVFDRMPTLREYHGVYGLPGIMNEKTSKDQAGIVKNDLLPVLGDFPLDRITFAEIEGLQNDIRKKKLSPFTVVQKMTVLRKILRHAVDNEILTRMPKFPTRPRLPQTQVEVTDREIVSFLSALREPKSAGVAAEFHDELMREAMSFFIIAAYTGLALADLRALKWNDIDFERRLITRERVKTSVLAQIPLNDVAVAALQEVRNRSVVSSTLVFVTRSGLPYSKTTIRRYFARGKRLAGIKTKFRFHDFRHRFISRLAEQGVSAFLVQRAAGHASVKTSERYVHLASGAIEAIRAAVSPRL